MDALNKWLTDTLGAWTLDFYGLFIILAAALALALIVTVIAVAVCHAKNKKKIKQLKEQADTVAAAQGTDELDAARLASLNSALIQKQNEIDELNARIATLEAERTTDDPLVDDATPIDFDGADTITADTEQNTTADDDANEALRAEAAAAEKAYRAETEARINDLYRTINELDQTNRDQADEINLLKTENAQIKAQALQQRIADAADKPEKTAAPGDEEDDEYDEYFDDYGDENSAVKVTLKFDRMRNAWIILRSDTDRTYRRLATKQEALVVAKDLARRLHAQLVVHKKDGKFQRV